MTPYEKIMKKVFKNDVDFENSYIYYQLIKQYLDHQAANKPKNKKKYIGIEIECFGPLDKVQVMSLILKHDLESNINITDDGSIESDTGDNFTYEFRILSSEDELPSLFKKLEKFLKESKVQVNETCGLHVHLDMRNRNVEKCYNKLLKFQDILFGMVDRDRWCSEYCQWSAPLANKTDRFTAINYNAYARHKTLEIRLHQGSVDINKIKNWVNLLIKMVNEKDAPAVKSKKDVLTWAGRDKKLKSYLSKFNNNWLKNKHRYIVKDVDDLGDQDEGYS